MTPSAPGLRLPALPPHAAGMRIGVFGGSFNPPHEGHRLVALTALRRLGLDAVWCVVTPGNPLKDTRELPPLADRLAAVARLMDHPRIHATGFEAAIGTRYTLETLEHLTRRAPQVRFVWIMGADNLIGFHRWQGWRRIATLMPLAVVDRPGATHRAPRGRAAQALDRWRRQEADARRLANMPAPAWVVLHGPRSALSSTGLRDGSLPPAVAFLPARVIPASWEGG